MKIGLVFFLCFLPFGVHAQFELDGVADLKPYFGYQGDLIEGLSNYLLNLRGDGGLKLFEVEDEKKEGPDKFRSI